MLGFGGGTRDIGSFQSHAATALRGPSNLMAMFLDF